MKKVFIILSLFLVSSAFANDIHVTTCSKDPSGLYVEITGDAALKILAHKAKSLNRTPEELGSFYSEGNGMRCDTVERNNVGQIIKVECSYLMKGKTNIPFPQADPGFSGEEIINCN